MKIKYLFVGIISLLMVISISQIFSIPPYGEDIFPLYKSGYFSELDKNFKIVRDSFLEIKTLKDPINAWIYLDSIKKKYNITVKAYDYRGYEVISPRIKAKEANKRVLKQISSIDPEITSHVEYGKYFSSFPLIMETKCSICHTRKNECGVIGVLTFERKYDAHIYYSAERILLFLFITILLGVMLFALLRWDPVKKIRELFDKK